MMKLTLEMEAEVKFCIEEFTERLNKDTDSDFTTEEGAVIILKTYLISERKRAAGNGGS